MRTTIALATFLVAGAGALGASALDLKGSDTLEGITKQLLTTAAWDCGGTTNTPAGTLVYIGTGSSNGESAIIAGTQQVAPMSRFLNPAVPATTQVCTLPNAPGSPGAASEQTSEGIAFARDGLAIVVSQATGGTDTCNGVEGSACSPLQQKGMAFAGKILTVPGYVCPTAADVSPFRVADSSCQNGQYKILDSQDVLRLVYYGLDHDFKGMAQRNCGNPNAGSPYLSNPGRVRAVLLETWGNLFQDAANCTGCTRLWRAFRRNDESGTTDAFISLTGRTAVCDVATAPCTAATMGLPVTVAIPTINQANRVSPFCNVRQAAAVQCGPGEQGGFDNFTNPNNLPHKIAATAVNSRAPVDADPPPPPTAPGGPSRFADPNPVVNGWDFPDAQFGTIGADPYFTDFQDFDCIRRQCAGVFASATGANEHVCSARGDLGVVLPIWDPPAPTATIEPFPTADCAPGVFISAAAPPCQGTGASAKPSLCPNGEKPISHVCTLANQNPGVCPTPATAAPARDPRCRNSAINFPPTQRRVDARVYNLHLHENNTTPNPDHPYATATRQNPAGGLLQAKMVGAFYRIHQNQFMGTARTSHLVIRNSGGDFSGTETTPSGATAPCNPTTISPAVVSATTLIGCYAGSASRCSIGYAGGEGAQLVGADALRLNGIGADTACVQAGTYPLSRKLYLNTVKGFETVTGDELKLAKCFAERRPGILPGGYPGIDSVAVQHGFIPLDTNVNNGTDCEDFNEELCGSAPGTNVNACANNPAGIPQ